MSGVNISSILNTTIIIRYWIQIPKSLCNAISICLLFGFRYCSL